MPLTERILSRLPGNRLAWIVAWVLVPWANLLVLVWAGGLEWETTQELSIELLNRVAVSFALLLSLWGTARIGADLNRVRLALTESVEEDQQEVDSAFRGIDNIALPLLMTAVVAIVLPVDEALRGEPLAAVVQGVTWLFIGIPLATVVWVYLALQLGLNRLGRGRLTVKRYSGDRTLGLQPVGSLAFTGFWMLFGTVTPLILTSFADLPTVLVGSAVLIAGLVMFFVSLSGLHRKMAAIRRRELDDSGALYREAYRPVQQQPTLDLLDQQTSLLNAAENLEKRAERIQTWPFDEATFARVATIATSAAASIVARMLLAPTGL